MYNDSNDVVVVTVTPGNALDLAALAALNVPVDHIFGAPGAPGWALWGWFDADTLNASGRTRTVGGDTFRRPALGAEGFDLEAVLTYCMFDEDGNLNLFAIWSLWGDVNDDDVVDQHDLNALIAFVALQGVATVLINQVAANVVVDGAVCQLDQNLLTQYVGLIGVFPVNPIVLGVQP